MRLRKMVITASAVILPSLFLAVVPSSPASAAPQCTKRGETIAGDNAGGMLWAPVAANGSTTCQMGSGSVSSAVGALQHSLKYCYGKSISEDNNFGPATKSALQSVQRQIGADDDGVYGPETRGKMVFSAVGTSRKTACYELP
ncbi:hypothetical protein GCM10009539_04630 [Cryptosporangium japonicum]|uniref:Peptidoglycan binding-like domain-containing protein n=1 Tax=Cryptosporangium japonicum TaxID=80872 RepID=A0ABN0TIH9_9ACTN